MVDVLLPQLGETVVEGTITRWFVGIGEAVVIDQPLYEVSTEKVDSEVPSPVAGVLVEIVVGEGAVVPVGALLCRIDSAGSSAATTVTATTAVTPDAEDADSLGSADAIGTDELAGSEAVVLSQAAVPPAGTIARRGGGLLLSPVVRRLLSEHGVDPSRLTGTGVAGRITRADVEQFLRDNPGRAEPFDGIRRATARLMVASKATSPHVLTAMEVDYTAVDMVRSIQRDAWRADEGTSLTYLPFIVSALCDALAEFPRLNASVGDDELIVHETVNLAVAVDLDFEGLVAPVVRGVEDRSIQEVARAIADVATRARSRLLSPGDLTGGTFTVTNPGQYGTLFQFPIINQPQVAILSTDGIARRPVVVADADGTESIEARSLGVLALAWDHRAFDGAYAAAFLRSMKRTLEEVDWAARWEAGRATDADG
ncbi:MAG: dihydrolipoamide acetyltransferase family protein [Acidimicrobiales bacterium]|jgi:2-oxoglutarate dehydrogenase E2 component (dihydrolipoamide succinyltransferase)|nr:dihydrolipoamide acetyltransferase family protein [Acidimicrobiales bacterium]